MNNIRSIHFVYNKISIKVNQNKFLYYLLYLKQIELSHENQFDRISEYFDKISIKIKM